LAAWQVADLDIEVAFQYVEHGFGFANTELPADFKLAEGWVGDLDIETGVAADFIDDLLEGFAGKHDEAFMPCELSVEFVAVD